MKYLCDRTLGGGEGEVGGEEGRKDSEWLVCSGSRVNQIYLSGRLFVVILLYIFDSNVPLIRFIRIWQYTFISSFSIYGSSVIHFSLIASGLHMTIILHGFAFESQFYNIFPCRCRCQGGREGVSG